MSVIQKLKPHQTSLKEGLGAFRIKYYYLFYFCILFDKLFFLKLLPFHEYGIRFLIHKYGIRFPFHEYEIHFLFPEYGIRFLIHEYGIRFLFI